MFVLFQTLVVLAPAQWPSLSSASFWPYQWSCCTNTGVTSHCDLCRGKNCIRPRSFDAKWPCARMTASVLGCQVTLRKNNGLGPWMLSDLAQEQRPWSLDAKWPCMQELMSKACKPHGASPSDKPCRQPRVDFLQMTFFGMTWPEVKELVVPHNETLILDLTSI